MQFHNFRCNFCGTLCEAPHVPSHKLGRANGTSLGPSRRLLWKAGASSSYIVELATEFVKRRKLHGDGTCTNAQVDPEHVRRNLCTFNNLSQSQDSADSVAELAFCRTKSQTFGVMPRARGLGLVRSRKSQGRFRKPNGLLKQ